MKIDKLIEVNNASNAKTIDHTNISIVRLLNIFKKKKKYRLSAVIRLLFLYRDVVGSILDNNI